MKKMITSLFALLGLVACGHQGFENADVNAFVECLKNPDVVLLDVRTAAEFDEGHIANALNIDVKADDFVEKINRSFPKKKR